MAGLDKRSEHQKNLPGKKCKFSYTKNYGNCITYREVTGTVKTVTEANSFIVLTNGIQLPIVNVYNIEFLG